MRSEKLLVFLKPKFLGDAVMATPLLKLFSENFYRPYVLSTSRISQMLGHALDKFQVLEPLPNRGIKNTMAEAKRLKEMHFDQVLLVNRSLRSAWVALSAGIPSRVGHMTEGRSPMLTVKVPWDKTKFEGETYGDLARAIGLSGDFSRVHLDVSEEERLEGSRLLQGATVGLQPGARFEEKMIPTEVMARVADQLSASGYRLAILGGPEEREIADRIKGLSRAAFVDLVGKCTLRESMGASSQLKLMIGASTGLMHIAVAVGCPAVTVFGKTLSSTWGHRYPPHQCIQIPSGEMRDVRADEILEAADKALGAGL